jgi:2-oxoisovalerate dehydrogenase E1 component
MLSEPHPVFDWFEVARLALTSRTLDRIEEEELTPRGDVKYQFSAGGHELVQLLLSQLLDQPSDGASVYYRSRPFMLGMGLTVEEALVSGMAREGGVSNGRDVGVAFNMPRRDRALVFPMAGDVGSQFTPAAGWAQSIQYHRDVLGDEKAAGSISLVCCGDGAVASNGFWSALTIATTLSLPLLFVVEDNGYAISVKGPAQTPGGNIAANLASFSNLMIWDGNGTDPAETADLVYEAVQAVRQGKGPGLLRVEVPRLSGHSSMDNQGYKTEEETAEERLRDPLSAIQRYLVPALMRSNEWEALEREVEEEVRLACATALTQPLPDPAKATEFVLSDSGRIQEVGGMAALGLTMPQGSDVPTPPDPRRINFVEAVRRTLDVELSVNPRCLVFGEDVGLKGGVHAATLGLQTKHGENRVFDTSLSEEGIIGRAIGMAYAGLVPVPEIQFRKYADPATEQLNNCGTIRWRSHNRFAAPMVVRIPGGYRKIGDPWHSVTSEIVFAHAVGWKLAFPSNAEDAVGLLRSAMRGNDPVIFFEHRAMLDAAWARRPYPGDAYVLPFGRAKRISQGSDLTLVTWGAMVERCQAAAERVDGSIEIIDLRTIVPWDKEMVLDSVRKTSRCLIVHEDIGIGGFGAEIAATIVAEAFLELDAPVERVTAPSAPIPYDAGLMDAIVPNVTGIRRSIETILAF